MPKPNTEYPTKRLLADIVVRRASDLLQKNIERRAQCVRSGVNIDAQASHKGADLVRSLALLGASRIAARSPVGLAVVAGGLALKLLYDRGRARRARIGQAGAQSPPESQARRPDP